MKIRKDYLEHIFFVLPLVLAFICVVTVSFNNQQAVLPVPMPQKFIGEYSYDGETWQPLVDEADISALDGDLFLRGNFLREMQEGWKLNFYRNHIGVSIKVNGEQIYMDTLMMIPDLPTDLFAAMCAREWMCAFVPAIGQEDIVEIHLHNPHIFGNKTAYKDFLTTLCSDPVGQPLLEKKLASYGEYSRTWGMVLLSTSLILLGAALAAGIVRIPVRHELLKLGMFTLFTGGYVIFDSIDVCYWHDVNIINTYAGQLCLMLAVFCLSHFVSGTFSGKRQKIAKIAVLLSSLLNSVLIILSFTGVTVMFDTLPFWIGSQIILCPLFIVCCLLEMRTRSKELFIPFSVVMMYAAILVDMTGVGANIIWRAPFSKIVFVILFVVHLVAVAKDVVMNYQASVRAAKLEKELEESRITIMLSQIKPHFLYNVLNDIYHLYRKEPEAAQEAVSNFAEYLRCNMLSIEKCKLIPFAEEYQHIQTYLSLEQVRFRDKLRIVYDVEVTDFKLPPLSIEPLVENAVKHGVTKKRGGGVVTISTRMTNDSVVITVADTGVGFDADNYMQDGKPHVGIRNVRERLWNMVEGSLSISSTEDGTAVVVTIPIKRGQSE